MPLGSSAGEKINVADDIKLDPEQERLAREQAEKVREQLKIKSRIALVGFSGAGKSSLFNAILGRPVSEEPAGGVKGTTAAHPEEVKGFILVDCPGYGAANMKPPEIILRETMDPHVVIQILNGAEGLHDQDIALYRVLSRHVKTIVALNKIDILDPQERAEAESGALAKMGVLRQHFISVSARSGAGVEELVRMVLANLPSGMREGFLGQLEGHLSVKNEEAARVINYYAGGGAVVGLSPIPFSDLIAMYPMLVAMTIHVAMIYGHGEMSTTDAARLVTGAIGSGWLARFAVRQILKIIPGIGQMLGAAAVFATIQGYGRAITNYFSTGMKAPRDKLHEYFKAEYAKAEAEARKMDFSKLRQAQGGK